MTDFLVPPDDFPNERQHRRLIAQALIRAMAGGLNVTGSVTLTANVASTVVSDKRVGPETVICFMPTTLNAAAEQGAGAMYVSGRTDEQFTISHANNAQTDRTFGYSILG